ncbi:oxygen-dependent protoporphyrinogen oxidase [Fodinibius salinus]|uniref:Coproporphyrinogen III oxidase n=1 Tax=Fodinibius salinus TaxID=860790 RepID=A0A5D3YIN6_9BACT|nr:protoporphyrinogen oxidase [Fodinibius salinus]TYP93300.1 oxygen-dependent protoporphyrinogen oxidase [Fodinibius salinus]
MTNKKSPVAILGAGISGLTTAHVLAQQNVPVTVYEKRDEVGGAIHSTQKDDWLVEEGPNTLMVRTQKVWDFLAELELDERIREANEAAQKRFIIKNGTAVVLPNSLGSFLSTPLFSAGAKLRLLKEPFIKASAKEDESIADFIERRLGKQPLDYGVNPFVSGIFAGDPKQLSIKHTFSKLWEMEQKHGSLVKGMFKKDRSNTSPRKALISFDGGNQVLPKALATELSGAIQTSTTVTSVTSKDGGWQVKAKTGTENITNQHDCVVSTIPAYATTGIFENTIFDEFAKLPYAPLSVLALGYKKEQVSHPLDGFGMLVPEVEAYNLLGCLFSSTLFERRAPEGHHLITCFIGGARNPSLASKPKQKLRSIVTSELDELLGIAGDPLFCHHKFWDKAIPQYEVGYDRFISQMEKIERQQQGLYFDGNYRNGVSVPDCISTGMKTAEKVSSFLRDHNKKT